MVSTAAGSVNFIGDLMTRRRLAALRRNGNARFDAALAELQHGHMTIANLEMPLSRRGYRAPKYSNMRSDPAIADDVRAMGVDAVTLTNNHMMDYGPDALFDTLAACDAAGLARCGAGADLDAADLDAALAPAQLDVDGRRLGLLNVSCTLPVGSEAAPGKPGIAPLHVEFSFEVDTNLLAEQPGTMPMVRSRTNDADRAAVCQRVTAMRAEADDVVVAVHWGVPSYWLSPHQGLLAEYQQPLAHALIEAGADMVYGHHAHSLHPIEVYQGKPIFYSLGNFMFDEPRAFMEPEFVIVSLILGDRPSIALTPLLLDERGMPRLVKATDAAAVLDKIERLSASFGTVLSRHAERASLVLP